jgi:hypothetical protein
MAELYSGSIGSLDSDGCLDGHPALQEKSESEKERDRGFAAIALPWLPNVKRFALSLSQFGCPVNGFVGRAPSIKESP